MSPDERQREREKRERYAELRRKQWDDPETRAKLIEARRRNARRQWDGPDGDRHRAVLIARNKSDEQRAAVSASMRERNADPEFKERLRQSMREVVSRPEVKARNASRARELALQNHERKRKTRDVVPPGQMPLYKKLRKAGIDRKEALRQCWLAHGEAQ